VHSGPLVRDKISLWVVLVTNWIQTYLEAYESWNNKWQLYYLLKIESFRQKIIYIYIYSGKE
jgi:hypothetical protein